MSAPGHWGKLPRCGITNKIMHPTKDSAKAQRASLMAAHGKDRSRTNVIRCGFCDHWHCGRR